MIGGLINGLDKLAESAQRRCRLLNGTN